MTIADKLDSEQKSSIGLPTQVPANDKRRALGRGLDSLLGGRPRAVPPTALPQRSSASEAAAVAETEPRQSGDAIVQIALNQIDENPYQTRRTFSEEGLRDLTESIRASGLIQPIVVRPTMNNRYKLVLGERRCRASRLAGRQTIPAMVRAVSDQQAAEMTVVENLQRQDLNCLEQANAFARLSRDFGLTQEQIGQRTGVSRESVANYIRLLKLPDDVQKHISDGSIGFSEARVLLQLSDPDQIVAIAERAVRDLLSVAALRDLVERVNLPTEEGGTPTKEKRIDPNVRAAQSDLERALGLRVKITDRKGKGRIVIEYSDLEDFDRVIGMLGGKVS